MLICYHKDTDGRSSVIPKPQRYPAIDSSLLVKLYIIGWAEQMRLSDDRTTTKCYTLELSLPLDVGENHPPQM